MLWPLSVVLVANTNGRLAIPALAGLLVYIAISIDWTHSFSTITLHASFLYANLTELQPVRLLGYLFYAAAICMTIRVIIKIFYQYKNG